MAEAPETEDHGGSPAQIASKMVTTNNPRVEIDTSPPFGSVKEAVTHFGGSGSWIPLHVLRLAGHDMTEFDMDKVEKQAAELERDLILKEQETLEVLRELEAAKGIVEGLKLNLVKEVSAFMTGLDLGSDSGTSTPNNRSTGSLTLCPVPSPPGVILTELKEAKSNLNKTTKDLAVIRASVESLNKKMRTHKAILEKSNGRQNPPMADKEGETKRVLEESVDLSTGPPEFTFEALQFRKMEEAAQYEVIKATTEIEQTKMSIKMVEMRLVAAKKMEEAARAMEAVALAEKKGDNSSPMHEGITLSYEEYSALTRKAQKGEELSKEKKGDGMEYLYHKKDANLSTVTFLKNSEGTTDNRRYDRRTLEEALGPRIDRGNRRNLASEDGFSRERSEDVEMRKPAHNYTKNRSPYPFHGHARRGFGPLVGDEPNLINDESRPVLRSSVSIGDILSRKLILQDDIVVGQHVDSRTGREDVSLSQMLREQSGLIFQDSRKTEKEGRIEKQMFAQRKKFGFIHVSLPLTKQSKKKSQSQSKSPLNVT